MPELPEVETVRRQLAPAVQGRTIVAADTHWSAKFTPAIEAVGAAIVQLERLGKYLVFELDDGCELIVHLGMTGGLRTGEPSEDEFVRARWELDDGNTLEYRDVRRFGRIRVVDAGDYAGIPTLAAQGPDALSQEFTPEQLWEATRRSDRRIKTQLLSQRPVAGVGNIYADEALWRARIYPARRSITRREAAELHEAIGVVLQRALGNRGTTLRDYRAPDGSAGENQRHLDVYGRAGEPCERCGAELRRRVWDARSSTFCPVCQPR